MSPTSWPQCVDSSSGESYFLATVWRQQQWSVLLLGHSMATAAVVSPYFLATVWRQQQWSVPISWPQYGDSSSGQSLFLGHSMATAAVVSPYFLATVWRQQQWSVLLLDHSVSTAAVVSPTSWPQYGDSSSGPSIFLGHSGELHCCGANITTCSN